MDSKSGSLPLDEFTHISGVYDATSGEMQIHVNGELDSTSEASFTPAISSQPGAIGAELTDGSPTDSFDGVIDDVRVYDRALSQSEIRAIYDATK
ncbi:LamG domain-containing protein [Natronomonas gomsonensis]|uniref:LamG domain-containing protein n=1 Tax=Natronomonas gomsonensis TaxID=1046043 RepID=UPI00398C78B1